MLRMIEYTCIENLPLKEFEISITPKSFSLSNNKILGRTKHRISGSENYRSFDQNSSWSYESLL